MLLDRNTKSVNVTKVINNNINNELNNYWFKFDVSTKTKIQDEMDETYYKIKSSHQHLLLLIVLHCF